MSPVYSILESKQRWLILAGLSFVAGCVGAMMILAFAWSHAIALVWLYLGLILALAFCVRAFLDWKTQMEAALNAGGKVRGEHHAASR